MVSQRFACMDPSLLFIRCSPSWSSRDYLKFYTFYDLSNGIYVPQRDNAIIRNCKHVDIFWWSYDNNPVFN